jgi:hypothetical protein
MNLPVLEQGMKFVIYLTPLWFWIVLYYHKINLSFQEVNLCDFDFDYISKAVYLAPSGTDQGKLFLV